MSLIRPTPLWAEVTPHPDDGIGVNALDDSDVVIAGRRHRARARLPRKELNQAWLLAVLHHEDAEGN